MLNNKLTSTGPKMAIGSVVDPSAFMQTTSQKNFTYENSVVKAAKQNSFFKLFSK